MHLKPYISPECVVTMADGSYKSVAELTEGDEVQTYDMDTEEFDSANIHVNEQTSAKIIRISNIGRVFKCNPRMTSFIKCG